MTAPSIQVQRDNLRVGLFLAERQYGAELDDVLTALGYVPNSDPMLDNKALFERHFRDAQSLGRDAFRQRRPGYFTFNAQPFGGGYVYKITWYVWVNPETNAAQIVPMPSVDLRRMREFQDRYLDTRTATDRSIRAAHDIEEQRRAIERRDPQDLREIQQRMLADGSLGEILSGLFGLEYADMAEILPALPQANFSSVRYQFQQSASKISRLQNELLKEQSRIADQLMNWVILQTGLPNDAPQRALQDAAERISRLGGR